MATEESAPHCDFDRLFTKSVPHILEKIFFSLDYESFMACGKVCTAWKKLHSSESYQQRADELLVSKTIAETVPKAMALLMLDKLRLGIHRMDELKTYTNDLSDRLDRLLNLVPEFEGRDKFVKLQTTLSEIGATEELDNAKVFQMLKSISEYLKILSRFARTPWKSNEILRRNAVWTEVVIYV